MENKIKKGEFPWSLAAFIAMFFAPFIVLFFIMYMTDHGEVLINKNIILSRLDRTGQGMIAYPKVDRLVFFEHDFDYMFNISDAPKLLRDLANHRVALPRPLIKSEVILPPASWLFRSRQKIIVYPELEIVALAEGNLVIGYWKTNDAPEVIKKWMAKEK